MSTVTLVYTALLYGATLVLAGGLAFQILSYARTPAPLKIPTMPAPVTRTGVVMRLAREVAFFESLFKSNKWTWLFAAMFHLGLLLEVLRHLRYFVYPVWTWVVLIQPFGVYGGFIMVAGLVGLLGRRMLVGRVRYVTGPSDYLMLLLLLGIAASGMAMTFAEHIDVVSFKEFVLGLIYFDWRPLPASPLLLIHLSLVALLMILFPFSKLMHGPGVFFSPTRNQVDDARQRRHLAPWAARLETPTGENQ